MYCGYNNYKPAYPQVSHNIILPVGGANPIDSGVPQQLSNVRGRVNVSITSGDNNYTSSFLVIGGTGECITANSQNFYLDFSEVSGGIVTQVAQNIFQMQTDVADAGGRIYIIRFVPTQSVGPNIQQTSVNIIGNFPVDVVLSKYVFN